MRQIVQNAINYFLLPFFSMIFMIIFVSANWRLYLDPTLDLTCGTILFVLSLLLHLSSFLF